jgi:hypothetical protein
MQDLTKQVTVHKYFNGSNAFTISFNIFSQHWSTYTKQSQRYLPDHKIASHSSDEKNNTGKENLINGGDSWYCKVIVDI